MNGNACFGWRFWLVSLSLAGIAAMAQDAGPRHPLDGLATAEYWSVDDVLQQAGHAGPESFFASVLLREPAKGRVLAWKEGSSFPREADVVILQQENTLSVRDVRHSAHEFQIT